MTTDANPAYNISGLGIEYCNYKFYWCLIQLKLYIMIITGEQLTDDDNTISYVFGLNELVVEEEYDYVYWIRL